MIKTFESIRAAYSGYCCICHEPFQDVLYKLFDWNISPDLIKVDFLDKDYIVFNQHTEEIVDMTITQTINYNQSMTFGGYQNFYSPPTSSYDISGGVFIAGHTVSCDNCDQYDYTLQLFVNINKRKIDKAILNSEFITLECDDNVYEITNKYTTGKTEYTHFSPDTMHKKLVLPLISNNMDNADDVLTRIKKILIFS